MVLAIIACQEPAVLVLDEPTNHLDLEMREALSIALQQYEGALLLVSHDRHLLRACVDDFWLVADGGVSRFKGGCRCLRRVAPGTTVQGPAAQKGSDTIRCSPAGAETAQDRGRHRGPTRGWSTTWNAGSPWRRRESKVDEINALSAERKQTGAALQRLEAAWLATQEAIDAAGGEEALR